MLKYLSKIKIDPVIKKEGKKQIKGFVVGLVVAFFITIAFSSVDTYLTRSNKLWEDSQIPYDIKWDYLLSRQLLNVRTFFLAKGFNKDGFFLSYLKKWHGNIYERAISKVPEDDGVRILLWYHYEIGPKMFELNENNVSTLVPEVVKALELLVNLHSKSEHIEKVEKYIICNNLLAFFVTPFYSHLLFVTGDDFWLPQVIKYSTWLAQDNKEVEAFFYHRYENTLPVSLMITAYKINLRAMLIKYNYSSDAVSCQRDEIANLTYYLNTIPELLEKYKNVKIPYYAEDFQRDKFLFEANYQLAKDFLLEKCNIKVKYDIKSPLTN